MTAGEAAEIAQIRVSDCWAHLCASLFGINTTLPGYTANHSECVITHSFLTSLSIIAHSNVSILVHCACSLQIIFITHYVYGL